MRGPPEVTRADTPFPYTTPFRSRPRRSVQHRELRAAHPHARAAMRSGGGRVHLDRRRLPPLFEPCRAGARATGAHARPARSEEHTSELQSLMRISYAVFCLKTKN